MHHTASVSIGERARDVVQRQQHVRDRQRFTVRDEVAQRCPFDKGHEIERHAVCGNASGQHRNDVGVLQRGGQCDFSPEPLDGKLLRQLGRHYLHYDFATQLKVARHEHPAHSPAAQFATQ